MPQEFDPLSQLKDVLSDYDAAIAKADADIARANMVKAEALANKEHVQFTFSILSRKNQPIARALLDVSSTNDMQKLIESNVPRLSDLIVSIMPLGEEVTVSQAYEIVSVAGSTANKATVNAALHRLAKNNVLESLGQGVYRKPQKGEGPSGSNTQAFNLKPSPVSGA